MIEYDADYYYNLLKIHTDTARKIVDIRYQFIRENILSENAMPDTTVLDYGCGVGFMKALAPEWIHQVDTFDVMPVPMTGITRDKYDIITMYDVLEHIPDFTEVAPVLKKGKFVVVTVPVKPDNVAWAEYKHFKPGEHLHYFTDDLIEHLFDHMGFYLKCVGNPECPPREYVKTYVFTKK